MSVKYNEVVKIDKNEALNCSSNCSFKFNYNENVSFKYLLSNINILLHCLNVRYFCSCWWGSLLPGLRTQDPPFSPSSTWAENFQCTFLQCNLQPHYLECSISCLNISNSLQTWSAFEEINPVPRAPKILKIKWVQFLFEVMNLDS